MSKQLRLIYLGDIVGRSGREILKTTIPSLKEKYNYDLLIVNAENSAGGRGISPKIAEELFTAGVDFMTLGDHIWDEKKIIPYLENNSHKIIAPANLAPAEAGKGYAVIEYDGTKIAICNLLGRVFMNLSSDCPFQKITKLLAHELKEVKVKILDFHAEATSEKYAMFRYLTGKMSLIVGTHTHVPTADQQISGGTGYVTDLGMTGSQAHVIGLDSEAAILRFTGVPKSFKVGVGEERVSGVYAEIHCESGECVRIERV